MNELTLYFIFLADRVDWLLIFLAVASAIIGFTRAMMIAPDEKTAFKILINGLVIGCVFIIIQTFIPSTKQLLYIYVVPKVTNNKELINLSNKSLKYLELYLDRKIKQEK